MQRLFQKSFLCIVLSFVASSALADAEVDIKYRKAVYGIVGGHMSSMGTILKEGVHRDEFAFHAKGMAEVAKLVPGLFPDGSDDGKTNALPAIWSQPDEFQEYLDDFLVAAEEMGKVADSNDMRAIGGAMKALGGSCKGCHDKYKAD